ncbi:MAG: 50S ribosomal protein L6 [Candidatus Uhrbacteria bacterium]|nr:50S ribosomal protein L6 [Candidatus Uhrbacteria bacterium]
MSRIGKKPIILPSGFDVNVDAGKVIVKGPKASLTVELPPHAAVEIGGEPKALTVTVEDPENVKQRALWGLTRQLIANAVTGLQTPFEKSLEFVGVGYKVALEGKNVAMDVGFSHRVMFPLPEGLEASVDKQVLTLKSSDKHLLGETAAQIRRVRPPEPYKGKGIKYVDEVIRRKAGKTAKSA